MNYDCNVAIDSETHRDTFTKNFMEKRNRFLFAFKIYKCHFREQKNLLFFQILIFKSNERKRQTLICEMVNLCDMCVRVCVRLKFRFYAEKMFYKNF